MIKYFCDGCNKEMFFHLEKNSPKIQIVSY